MSKLVCPFRLPLHINTLFSLSLCYSDVDVTYTSVLLPHWIKESEEPDGDAGKLSFSFAHWSILKCDILSDAQFLIDH